jgi:hypothetical protein
MLLLASFTSEVELSIFFKNRKEDEDELSGQKVRARKMFSDVKDL